MKIHAFDTKKQKQVLAGEYDATTGAFWRKASPKHYMVIYKGYGFQDSLVSTLENLNCKLVRLVSKTKMLEFDFADFKKYKPKNVGHGPQYFVPVANMREL